MKEQEYYSELYVHQQGDGGKYVQGTDTGSFQELLASYYCKQVDDAKIFASILEYYSSH